MSYKAEIPEIANRIKFCATPDAVVEFFKTELLNAYQTGWQDGHNEGVLDGTLNAIREVNQALETKPIPDLDRPEIAGEKRLHPIFENLLAATRMGRV